MHPSRPQVTRAQLSRIELQGFRSFGNVRQFLDLAFSVSTLWGGNSQGKTSFVEALEFLFTGQIARRELLASTKDEFAEALRNAHIAPAHPVWVAAKIVCTDGQTRTLTRRLVEDYRRGSAAGCTSRLEIDGHVCTEDDIRVQLGLRLSHPPLRAPVLSQHTLGYLFSVSPTDRAAYFRAMLDTQELEDFRTGVAALQPLLKAPELPALDDLVSVEAIPELAVPARQLCKAKTETALLKALAANTSALLTVIGISPGGTLDDQAAQIEAELQRRRERTFPLDRFARSALMARGGPPATLAGVIDKFISERAKIDAEARRLVDLFQAALSLPHQPGEHDPVDCRLCGAPKTFTAERVTFIRTQLAAAESYTAAVAAIQTALRSLDGQLEALAQSVERAHPKFIREISASRRAASFTVAKIAAIGPDAIAIRAWLDAVRPLWRAACSAQRRIATARAELAAALSDPDQWNGAESLAEALLQVGGAHVHLEACLSAYDGPAKEVGRAVKAAVDQSVDTKGWEALVRICRDPHGLWAALVSAATHSLRVKTLEKALADIDTANGKVADSKFSDLSDGIRHWWDLLRPNEAAYFDAVQRRSGKARRTIDLKVGLSSSDDRSNAKIRDAIAVFSQSQLHCLGLSMFLARAIQENAGFIILDDPVLTSDDDYRPNFVASVIESLLAAGLQVIICTQDHKSWKDIGDRWAHRGAIQFQMMRNDAVIGTEIRSQNDDLATMMAKAQPFIRSQDPVVRKEGASRLREAIERFAKMIVVRERQKNGEPLASITDYDGKNFGTYSQQAMNLLSEDPSHPGKLKASHQYVTPGPHDDKPPSSGELVSAYGELKKLKKDYLD
jgi:hypothetical protein